MGLRKMIWADDFVIVPYVAVIVAILIWLGIVFTH